MTKVIEEPKVNEQEKEIYNPEVKTMTLEDTKLKISLIKMEEDYTRIDFVGNNGDYGWVQIDPNSFIRPVGTKTCYKLVKVKGIALAPQKHFFKKANQTFYFTLYYPALPKSVKEIDIIENENPDDSYFNFYGVSIEKIRKETLRVGN